MTIFPLQHSIFGEGQSPKKGVLCPLSSAFRLLLALLELVPKVYGFVTYFSFIIAVIFPVLKKQMKFLFLNLLSLPPTSFLCSLLQKVLPFRLLSHCSPQIALHISLCFAKSHGYLLLSIEHISSILTQLIIPSSLI